MDCMAACDGVQEWLLRSWITGDCYAFWCSSNHDCFSFSFSHIWLVKYQHSNYSSLATPTSAKALCCCVLQMTLFYHKKKSLLPLVISCDTRCIHLRLLTEQLVSGHCRCRFQSSHDGCGRSEIQVDHMGKEGLGFIQQENSRLYALLFPLSGYSWSRTFPYIDFILLSWCSRRDLR